MTRQIANEGGAANSLGKLSGQFPKNFISWALEESIIPRCIPAGSSLVALNATRRIPPGVILFSLSGLMVMYAVFFVVTLYFGRKIIAKGPNLTLPAPRTVVQPTLVTEPAQHIPDQRPVEASQS